MQDGQAGLGHPPWAGGGSRGGFLRCLLFVDHYCKNPMNGSKACLSSLSGNQVTYQGLGCKLSFYNPLTLKP